MLIDIGHQPEKGKGQQAAERANEDKPGHVPELMGSNAQHFGQSCSEQLRHPSTGVGDAHKGSIQGGLHSLQAESLTAGLAWVSCSSHLIHAILRVKRSRHEWGLLR